MEMMQWNEVLATGIPVIDNQHKKLLELANQSPHGAVARIRVPEKAVHEICPPENEDKPRLTAAAS